MIPSDNPSPNPDQDFTAASDAAERRLATELARRVLETEAAPVVIPAEVTLAAADWRLVAAIANREGSTLDAALSGLVARAVADLDLRSILGGGAP